jgi:hypothetical protein
MKQILLLAVLASITSISYGQTLVLDDEFDRGTPASPVALNGTSPTFSTTPETWTADPSITTDGTQVLLPEVANSPDNSVLGYVGIPGVTTGTDLAPGSTYTLTYTFTPPTGGSAWTAAGFGQLTNTGDVPYLNGNTAGFWTLDNGAGVSFYYSDSPGVNNQLFYDGMEHGVNTVTLTIQKSLSPDTTDTLSATLNGNPVPLSTSNAIVESISQIFVGDADRTGSVESMKLSVTPLTFDLNGPTVNNPIDLGSQDFTPVGGLTFNFTTSGPLLTSEPGSPNFYTLVSGSGDWDGSGATFNFNAPAGYVVARYDFDSFADTFAVDFQVVPEPSTWAMLLGGMGLLAFWHHYKRRAQV